MMRMCGSGFFPVVTGLEVPHKLFSPVSGHIKLGNESHTSEAKNVITEVTLRIIHLILTTTEKPQASSFDHCDVCCLEKGNLCSCRAWGQGLLVRVLPRPVTQGHSVTLCSELVPSGCQVDGSRIRNREKQISTSCVG